MMMKRVALCVLVAMCAFAAPLLAADPTGVWKGVVNLPAPPAGQAPAAQPGNPPVANAAAAPRQALPFVARLKQDGTKITGTLDGINGTPDVEIVDGKIEKDVVTFKGTRVINNMPVTFNYTATFVDADTLDFKILRADGTGAPLESLTKRSKD